MNNMVRKKKTVRACTPKKKIKNIERETSRAKAVGKAKRIANTGNSRHLCKLPYVIDKYFRNEDDDRDREMASLRDSKSEGISWSKKYN